MRRVEGIRAVTYDCWGTLLRDHDWEGAMEIRLGALLRFLDISEEEGRALLEEAWQHHDEAWKQIETFGPGRMAAYCLEARGIDDDDKISALTEEFERASMNAGVDAVEGAKDTLVSLEKAGIGLGLVCDTGFTSGKVVRELLEKADLLQHLPVLCFSDEVGVPKPDTDIFAKALAGLGVRPYEAAHVGDLRRTDIAGAREIGMLPVRFRGVHDDKSDFRDADCLIDRHEQIRECIGLE
ncbi:MAG: putative hydrolase of the superfamily [Actinomycetota bacterium]|jgi:putative hydrolase of the HAD superfamily|nr:putative hydrolase of the superfamily [Actinomycetota bacterium]